MTALDAAYEQCREIMAEYGRTYYLATRLLPADRRRHVWALYGYTRLADELVDSGDPDSVALQRLSEATRAALDGGPVREPILVALAHTMSTYSLSPGLVEEFLHSMRMDLTCTRYDTWADLRGYMRGSAAVIGELMAPVLGGTDPAAASYAGLLGEAFQLTNFVRDVAEDWERGRVYLPLEDLAAHGVTVESLGRAVEVGRATRPLRELVRFECVRAVDLYAGAAPGLDLLDAAGRRCVRTAFVLYRMILREVADADYDVFAARAVVPRSTRLRVAGSLVLGG